MAIASVTFGAVGGQVQAMSASDVVSEVFTTSASTQATAAATTANKPVVRIASDVALYVSIGAAPNAEEDAGRFYFPAGALEYFITGPGQKVALVAA
jgi:hypothetical protein